jgi:hypothetical protein
MCMKKKIVDFLLVSVFRSKIYFAKYEQSQNRVPFLRNFGCFEKTEIMRNSVLNHFAKQKRNWNFVMYNCKTKRREILF